MTYAKCTTSYHEITPPFNPGCLHTWRCPFDDDQALSFPYQQHPPAFFASPSLTPLPPFFLVSSSSVTRFKISLAVHSNAFSTFHPSFAEVST